MNNHGRNGFVWKQFHQFYLSNGDATLKRSKRFYPKIAISHTCWREILDVRSMWSLRYLQDKAYQMKMPVGNPGRSEIYLETDTSWWRHQMETFSALLALCDGNPPVFIGFPSGSQRPVTLSIGVFFHPRMSRLQWAYREPHWKSMGSHKY